MTEGPVVRDIWSLNQISNIYQCYCSLSINNFRHIIPLWAKETQFHLLACYNHNVTFFDSSHLLLFGSSLLAQLWQPKCLLEVFNGQIFVELFIHSIEPITSSSHPSLASVPHLPLLPDSLWAKLLVARLPPKLHALAAAPGLCQAGAAPGRNILLWTTTS